MAQTRICPDCHSEIPADAPQGLCPACVLRAGIDGTATRSAPRSERQAPTPEELSERLPELEVLERIGQGGMGTVYRARQRELDRPVALKVLFCEPAHEEAFAQRFVREARTLARLDHPHIVSVYDFGYREGLYYLVMELVDGVSLRQALESGGLAPREALSIVPKICEALQYAHDRGVVHRDIKPENILLDRRGAVKVADFGLAKLLGGEVEPRLTAPRQVMGTPHYMAPEQIEQPEAVDHRADIFALGVVFYELLTGELPVGRFPVPSQRVAIDVRLDDVVLRTLEKEPGLRYQRASELQTEVESLSVSAGRGKTPGGSGQQYEFRSKAELWGLPLLHIAFSRDASGSRMALARGIVAIGDKAIGGVAVGGLALGGITFGGLSLGFISVGGLALGLIFALGGVAAGGGMGIGGFAVGLLATGGAAYTLWPSPDPTFIERVRLAVWLAVNAILAAATLLIGAVWLKDPKRGKNP